MQAITLWQPYASLIAEGIKTTETRSWAPKKEMLGERIAIHASKRKISTADWERFPIEMQQAIILKWGSTFEVDIPYGAVVATAVLADVKQVHSYNAIRPGYVLVYSAHNATTSEHMERPIMESIPADPFGDYSTGRKIWILEDIKKLGSPIKCPGRQNLWNCDWHMGAYNAAQRFAEEGRALDFAKD